MTLCHGWRPIMRGLGGLVLSLLLQGPVMAVAADNDNNAVHCLALNLYWEARSEGEEGMIAVGWVVLNRMAHPKYPATACEVIHQGGVEPPCQWSWWCDGRSDKPTEPKAWAQAQTLAKRLLQDPPSDPTYGAIWFHHERLEPPSWLNKRESVAYIGKHIFYK